MSEPGGDIFGLKRGDGTWGVYGALAGGPPGESTADWMDRLVELGLAARGSFASCFIDPGEHEWGDWHASRWQEHRARRDCANCGQFELRRLYRFVDKDAA